MGWIVEYNDGSATHTYSVTQMSFKKTLVGINSGSFTLTLDGSGVKCPVDVVVTVKLENSVSQTTDPVILYGRTTKVGEYNKGLYNVTIAERANELKNMYVEDDDDAFVVKVGKGTSSGPYLTTFVDTILNSGQASDTGWDISTASQTTYGSVYQIPGSSDVIPAQAYINTTCSASLDKFLRDICGLYFWFDNANKKISFGTNSGTTHAIDDYILDIKQTDEVTDNAIERIIVISSSTASSGAKYSGTAVSSTATAPYKTVMYQYDTATSNNDCQAIANQLLAESEDTKVRYEVTLPNDSDGLLINEADNVSIDGTSYLVQDVTISMNKIILGINSRANNFTDIISGNLSIVNGEGGLESVTTTWDGGEQNIGTSTDAEYKFIIDDINLIGDTVPIDLNYAPWKKSLSIGEGGYSTGYTESAYTGLSTTDSKNVSGTNNYYSLFPEYSVAYSNSVNEIGHAGAMKFITVENMYDMINFTHDYYDYSPFSLVSNNINSVVVPSNYANGGYDTTFLEVRFGVTVRWHENEQAYSDDRVNTCTVAVRFYQGGGAFIANSSSLKNTYIFHLYPICELNGLTGSSVYTIGGNTSEQTYNLSFVVPTTSLYGTSTYNRFGISMYKHYDSYKYYDSYYELNITDAFFFNYCYVFSTAYKAHTHTWSDISHANAITDKPHQNQFDDTHENHDEDDDLDEVGTGVLTPTLKVNGTDVILSGSSNIYSASNIKSLLTTGTNTITLGSNPVNKCSVQPTITYEIFG